MTGTAPVLGLFAGGGTLPVSLFDALAERGHPVVVVGFKGETDEALMARGKASIWVDVNELGKTVEFLRAQGVREALMAGYVKHEKIFKVSPANADSFTSRILHSVLDHRADSILKVAAWQLKRHGIVLVSAMPYLKPLVPAKGVLTRRQPSDDEWKDVRFGHGLARKIAGLDIGQTVVVKQAAVLAVEAIEGTDAAIRRAGELGGGGVVVVKVAKPKQDFRFDVPVIGPNTIQSLVAAKAAVLAIEAGKTILLHRDQVIEDADRHQMAVVAL